MLDNKKRNLKSLTYVDSKGKIIYAADNKLNNLYQKRLFNKNVDKYSLIQCYNELTKMSNDADSRHQNLKEKLNKLQEERIYLNFQTSNMDKEFNLKKGEKIFLDETNTKLKDKLNVLKENIRIKRFEHNTLKEEIKKLEKKVIQNVDKKNKVEEEFHELLNNKDDINTEISQQRVKVIKKRRDRQDQLKQLLLLIKQEHNEIYNIDYLKQVEKKIKNEITSYKNHNNESIENMADMNIGADIMD